jgi:ADP-ribosylation factor-like protein 1
VIRNLSTDDKISERKEKYSEDALEMTINICVFGFDKSDVRTYLQRLIDGKWFSDANPLYGKNGDTIQDEDIKFSGLELSNIQFRRALWGIYTKFSKGLIFVIDLSDTARFPENRNYLWRLLSMNRLKTVPVAIFVNKDRLKDETDETNFNSIGINQKGRKSVEIFTTSASTGEGIR